MQKLTVGLLLFDEIEVLDFAGPFEVLSLAEDPETKEKLFRVITVSETGALISARNGLKVQPECSFTNAPAFDILIVPGGWGAERVQRYNAALLDWIRARAGEVCLLASVCTGAFLLAAAGLLEGRRATTHWMDLDELERDFPAVTVLRGVKWVEDSEGVITSAGISAGINMAFRIVERLAGAGVARTVARRMEYDIEI